MDNREEVTGGKGIVQSKIVAYWKLTNFEGASEDNKGRRINFPFSF